MPGLTVSVILQDIKKIETEALVVGFFENSKPLKGLAGELDWLLCGSLSCLMVENKLHGALGETALLTSRGKVPSKKIFMIGLGPRDAFALSALSIAVKTAVSSAISAGVRNAAIEYIAPPGLPSDEVMPAILTGLSEGARGRSINIVLLAPDAPAYEKLLKLARGRSPQSQGFSEEAHS